MRVDKKKLLFKRPPSGSKSDIFSEDAIVEYSSHVS